MRPAPRASQELVLIVPDELLRALAERTAMLLAERLEPAQRSESPWLDFEGALAYLGFTRDRLYKLTAARAIPFRKKREGQGLLFHRGELDRWIEAHFESTGCAREVELWSSTTQQMPRRRGNAPGPATEV